MAGLAVPPRPARATSPRKTSRAHRGDNGAITRAPFTAGEPIREAKLIRTNGAAGYMAAILPSGMRAVSTEISPETGAGGFILPNDRVDVILSRRSQGRRQQEQCSAADQ